MVEMKLSGQYGTPAISIVHCALCIRMVGMCGKLTHAVSLPVHHQYFSMFGVDITADLPASLVECNYPPGAG